LYRLTFKIGIDLEFIWYIKGLGNPGYRLPACNWVFMANKFVPVEFIILDWFPYAFELAAEFNKMGINRT
jgi:hypothetical protein